MGNDTILLHPERGLNPRLTYCPRCNSNTNEIVLLGAHEGIYECSICKIRIIGKPPKIYRGELCPQCKEKSIFTKVANVGEFEKVPGSICAACKQEIANLEKESQKGGVFFKCDTCDTCGIIKHDSEFAINIRSHLNKPTGPLGVTIPKDQCPNCSRTTNNQ